MSELINALVRLHQRMQAGEKPHWVHVPDRVWRRNSALLMSIHNQRNTKTM